MTRYALVSHSSTCTPRPLLLPPLAYRSSFPADADPGSRMYDRDRNDPKNRKAWRTQHDALKFIDPPYVYHVVSCPLHQCHQRWRRLITWG